MKQYNQIKGKYPDALLLFRVGDFYETFGNDAIEASKILGIIQTKRKNGAAAEIELAGFPHHSLETYLPKLVRAGKRVAVCDQLEDPKLTKTIVKRGVTELVTPGISFNEQVLTSSQNNFLCALYFGKKNIGASFLDVSTGEFLLTEGGRDHIDKLINGFDPKEVIYPKNNNKEFKELCGENRFSFKMDDWVYKTDFAYEILTKHFKTNSLNGFSIQDLPNGIIAAGAIIQYLNQNQHDGLLHITSVSRIQNDKYIWLDKFTVRNLELVFSPHENALTLSQLLNCTKTAMGARLMHRWILLPLKDKDPIQERLDIVEDFFKKEEERIQLIGMLAEIGDVERMISKVSVGKATPREVAHLNRTLKILNPLKEFLKQSFVAVSTLDLSLKIEDCSGVIQLIEQTLEKEPAQSIGKGKVIKEGYHGELDELRRIAYSGKDYLQQLQTKESENTGIPSLKIAFNNVFGYYIEVRNTHKDKVPLEWIRKQTLVNAERYITEELKEYETKILGAEEKIHQIEARLYGELLEKLRKFINPIQKSAQIIAQIDCLSAFASISIQNNYCKPKITDSFDIDIKQGRHPVIEKRMALGEVYVPNDIYLSNDDQQIMMITGPNMSGKSAILRQTALIVLMAQMGCYVPAKSAEIGLIDKIFTRVGASDNISSGESTFMVEMNETASILNNLSSRSLILLDEIGRGTSTYDGVSIAWAIAEFLHEKAGTRAKTLFATHYHELNEMSSQFQRIKNYNVSVKESGKEVIFLRKLQAGGSHHSFGIHVAKMAGMPKQVISRAESVLKELEQARAEVGNDHKNSNKKTVKIKSRQDDLQLNIFQFEDPQWEEIRNQITQLDLDNLTPMEALNKLNELKIKLKK